MEIPLAQQFSDLQFAKDADGWLESIGDKSISEQLAEGKITEIIICTVAVKGLLLPIELTTGQVFFRVLISNLNSFDESYFVLGHEISHTFEVYKEEHRKYRASKSWPVGLFELVEKFCDEFSKIWLAINGKEKIVMFFENSGAVFGKFYGRN